MSLKRTVAFFILTVAIGISISGYAQSRLAEMQSLLKNSEPDKMEAVFQKLKTIADSLPYKEAIVYEDELLHTAANLPHYPQAFGWMYELAKTTYNNSGHEDNLFLYLLSIADDPAFQKRAIRNKILYETGFSYYNIGDYEKAQVALEEFVDNNSGPANRDVINGLTMLGLIYQDRQNFEEALDYLQQAHDKAVASKDTVWIGLTNGNLGSLYLDMGGMEEALPLTYLDIHSSIESSLYESAANGYFDLSRIAFKQNRNARAKTLLDSSWLLLQLDNRPDRKAWARLYKNFARYHHLAGHGDSAYHYLLLAQQISDSLQYDRNNALLKLRVSTFAQRKAEQDALLLKASMESSRQSRLFVLILILVI